MAAYLQSTAGDFMEELSMSSSILSYLSSKKTEEVADYLKAWNELRGTAESNAKHTLHERALESKAMKDERGMLGKKFDNYASKHENLDL
jgi:hypothetical protein